MEQVFDVVEPVAHDEPTPTRAFCPNVRRRSSTRSGALHAAGRAVPTPSHSEGVLPRDRGMDAGDTRH